MTPIILAALLALFVAFALIVVIAGDDLALHIDNKISRRKRQRSRAKIMAILTSRR